MFFFFFFFNDTATTEIYTLSLHDALPIWCLRASWTSRTVPEIMKWLSCTCAGDWSFFQTMPCCGSIWPLTWANWENTPRHSRFGTLWWMNSRRSEEHTSELQSQSNLVCRLLLEK